jgi:PAS domain S-box-containing protein
VRLRIRWGSLRIRIIAWAFIPTAIILMAVALVAFYAYQKVTEDLVIERDQQVTRLSADQLADALAEYVGILSSLARTANIATVDPVTQAIALKQARNRLAVFDGGTIILSTQGMVVAAEPPREDVLGKDWSARAYYRRIIRFMEPTFSDILTDGPAGAQVVTVAVPITGPQGEFLGILAGMFRVGTTSASSLYGNIVRLRIGEKGNMYLVDSGGQVIYHHDTAYIGADFSGQQAVRRGLGGQAGAIRTRNSTGQEIVAGFAPVPGTPWGLVSEESWASLLRTGQTYRESLLVLLALGGIIPTLVVAFGVRRITKPINDLIVAAQQVAGGNFGQVIAAPGEDELGELAAQFNRMSAQLRESYAALREREERLALVIQGTNDGIWDWNLETNEVYFSPRWKSMLGYEDHELANCLETWQQLIHPEDAERTLAAVQAHLESQVPVYQLEHRLRHKDGSYRWILARGIALRDAQGRPYRMAGSHSDITERKEAEEALRMAQQSLEQRVAERTHQLSTLLELSHNLASTLELHPLLEQILDQLRAVVDYTGASILTLEGEELRVVAHRGPIRQEEALSLRFPLREATLNSEVIRVRKPVIIPDVREDTTEARAFQDSAGARLETTFGYIRSWMGIPLLVRDRVIGMLSLDHSQPNYYSPQQADLALAFANQVAVAIENARLYEQAESTAVTAERQRLARDLHDAVTQTLFSASLIAEVLPRLWERNPEEGRRRLAELRELTRGALAEMRTLLLELRPTALTEASLGDLLRQLSEAITGRARVPIALTVEGKCPLPPDVQVAFYRIAQEALNNVAKHAGASQATVSLSCRPEKVELRIGDDGRGFVVAGVSPDHLGLGIMRERAEAIGAILDIKSEPGHGTQVVVSWSGEQGRNHNG